ncbi:hypothetical protein HanPI659440_Chr12g0470691 [Helianthus annuus]|nr:hypothetical protein HanPI659440_Chr12g0470691 [Helianthus annuus]
MCSSKKGASCRVVALRDSILVSPSCNAMPRDSQSAGKFWFSCTNLQPDSTF